MSNADSLLLERFEKEILKNVPHLEGGKVVNATPMKDITADLKACAKGVFNMDLADKDLRVFGKFDSKLLAGSIKARPAINIIHDAIATGKIKKGQTVFEATSGNFGIALGLIGNKIGINVVTLQGDCMEHPRPAGRARI
jgi:cysteine synthase